MDLIRRRKKNVDDEEEEVCDACQIGVPLGLVRQACESEGCPDCTEQFQKVMNKKISVKDYFKHAEKEIHDRDNLKSVRAAKKYLKEQGLL